MLLGEGTNTHKHTRTQQLSGVSSTGHMQVITSTQAKPQINQTAELCFGT